jgi:hypothetical protein
MLAEQLFLIVVRLCENDFAGCYDLANPSETGDLVLFHEELKTLSQLTNDAFFALHHPGEVEAYIVEFQAVVFGLMPGELEVIRRGQKSLAGNAADIETGATEHVPFVDNRSVKSKLRRSDRSRITGRSPAKDNQIV